MFLFILGLIEIGRGLMVLHLLNNAARQGCRAGVIQGKSTADINTVVLATLSAQGIKGEVATVQVNDGVTDASTARSGDEITVIVTVPVASVSWLPGSQFLNGSMAGRYTLRRE
jgi:Flp pilus assembly protein TadG